MRALIQIGREKGISAVKNLVTGAKAETALLTWEREYLGVKPGDVVMVSSKPFRGATALKHAVTCYYTLSGNFGADRVSLCKRGLRQVLGFAQGKTIYFKKLEVI